MRVFLIGYMGVGKTTVGKVLAARLGLPFFDLDAEIERHSGMEIPEIFAEKGEAHFRETERKLLGEMLEKCGYVLSLGGGTPTYGDNLLRMLESGTVIHLTLSLGALVKRLKKGKESRPLLADLTEEELHSFVAAHLGERLPHYNRAHLEFSTFDVSAARMDELVERIRAHQPTR